MEQSEDNSDLIDETKELEKKIQSKLEASQLTNY